MRSALFGSLSIDEIRLPGTPAFQAVSGSAYYSSLASALFCDSVLLGVAGKDYSKKSLQALAARGIDLSLLQHSKKPAVKRVVEYSTESGEATTLFRANNCFDDFSPQLLKGKLTQVQSMYVGKNNPAFQLELFKLMPKSAVQIMSTRPYWIVYEREKLEKALKLTDIFLLHDKELKLLVGEGYTLPEMIEKVMSYGPRVVVLMRDEHGLVVYGRMGTMVVPSFPLAFAVDPTGAGDAFGGALSGVLACLNGLTTKNLRKALILASVVSSFVVEDYGPNTLNTLTLKQVINRAQLFLNQLPTTDDIVNEKQLFS